MNTYAAYHVLRGGLDPSGQALIVEFEYGVESLTASPPAGVGIFSHMEQGLGVSYDEIWGLNLYYTIEFGVGVGYGKPGLIHGPTCSIGRYGIDYLRHGLNFTGTFHDVWASTPLYPNPIGEVEAGLNPFTPNPLTSPVSANLTYDVDINLPLVGSAPTLPTDFFGPSNTFGGGALDNVYTGVNGLESEVDLQTITMESELSMWPITGPSMYEIECPNNVDYTTLGIEQSWYVEEPGFLESTGNAVSDFFKSVKDGLSIGDRFTNPIGGNNGTMSPIGIW